MEDKPNPNLEPPKREIPPMPSQVSGDNIVIMGNVSAGANVGSGTVTANYISNQDMIINNGTVGTGSGEQFADLLVKLKEMLVQATSQLGDKRVQQITGLGKPIGPPWGKDQKDAALVALMVLSQ